MARFASLLVLVVLEQVVAPQPLSSVIEAYKPTTGLTTSPQDRNSGFGGFGGLNKLKKMLTNLEHKIDDIDTRRKIMEAQMKEPFSIFPDRMEAAVKYVNPLVPSIVYPNRRIVSANGVFLQTFEDGTANGTKDDTSPYVRLTLEMVGVDGKMLIKGEKGKTYLACKKSGKFHAVSNRSEASVFSRSLPPEPRKGRVAHHKLWKSKSYFNLNCDTYDFLLGFRHNAKLKKRRHSRPRQLDSWFIILQVR